MPRYLVDRDFGQISDEDMQEFAAVAGTLINERFSDIVWEGSRTCNDVDGGIKSFCVYQAPNPERLIEHAEAVGVPATHRVYEIVGDIDPNDIKT